MGSDLDFVHLVWSGATQVFSYPAADSEAALVGVLFPAYFASREHRRAVLVHDASLRTQVYRKSPIGIVSLLTVMMLEESPSSLRSFPSTFVHRHEILRCMIVGSPRWKALLVGCLISRSGLAFVMRYQ